MIRGSHARVLVLLLSAFAAGAAPAPARDQAPATAQPLDVPYLPQTEALCGGAAAAMVMRYWGARDIYPDAFAALVDRDAGGIPTSALEADLNARTWTVAAGPGNPDRIVQQLGRKRPVIALIEDRPGRFHYVVVVGWTADRVILHDPARAPFRDVDAAAFVRAWARANNWMMIALPPAGGAARETASEPAPTVSATAGPCAGLVEEGVKKAHAGDRASARVALEAAASACPRESGPLREIAGLDALDGNWSAAADHASAAVQRDAHDEHAWRILGTAAYLRDRPRDALNAWNHLGEPIVDLVDVRGLSRTRYAVIATAIDAPPGTLVTPELLTLAERRTREIPAIGAARVAFHPLENGRAEVDASVSERPLAPASPGAWVGLALRAITDRELAPAFASVTGGGELLTVSWRWWAHRPRAAFSLAAPAPRLLGGGVWRVGAFRETETFGRVPFEEVRTSAGVTISNWVTASTRVEGGASLDRWRGRDVMAALSGAIEFWPIKDRLALEGRASGWLGAGRFGSGGVQARWRSSAIPSGSVWLVTSGVQAASEAAPASLWPGADTGRARDVLLRAHPLLDDGVITGGVFGRRLVFGNAEWWSWLRPWRWPVRLAPAVFVDIARATSGLASTDSRTHVDAGIGARIALTGSGVMRLDLAKGLRDGRTAFTLGWTQPF